MTKKFFYVCSGLFLLALSYHVGARSAGAQAGLQLQGAALGPEVFGGNMRATFAIGRTFYWSQAATGNFLPAHAVPEPIPGSASVVATYGSGIHYVLLDNGDTYSADGDGTWVFRGNLFGGPTPTRQESMGSVKARYR